MAQWLLATNNMIVSRRDDLLDINITSDTWPATLTIMLLPLASPHHSSLYFSTTSRELTSTLLLDITCHNVCLDVYLDEIR